MSAILTKTAGFIYFLLILILLAMLVSKAPAQTRRPSCAYVVAPPLKLGDVEAPGSAAPLHRRGEVYTPRWMQGRSTPEISLY